MASRLSVTGLSRLLHDDVQRLVQHGGITHRMCLLALMTCHGMTPFNLSAGLGVERKQPSPNRCQCSYLS